ncbi:nucleotide exchange factor GrpE [Spirochaeta dissipatitropha]
MDRDEVCEEDLGRSGKSSAAEEQADTDSASSVDIETSEAEGDEAIQSDDLLGKLEARIAELEEENSELKDKYLRKHADFENFRKRMLREKEEFAKYANQQILSDLVSVIDDFERAISSSVGSNDFQSFHDGIVMIEKQLVSMLENRYHLTRFDDQGQEFDPQRHEAVASAPAAEGQESAKVEEVFQKGYLLHDRVIRSAKVKVSMP